MTRPGFASWILLLVGAVLLAMWASTPPAVLPADASPTRFSAARAMGVVADIAQAPHPIGSPEAASVRVRLASRMRALGMEVSLLSRSAATMEPGGRSVHAGRVDNLIGVLPGRDRALPAIALMAHSDTVPDSFGAADDGAGVAVALETVRAIRAGAPPARDVMLIVTDGEEAGLLGARAFFAERAWAGRVGAIVNIDSRGSGGVGAMFETGPGSGGLVALYRAHSTHRFAHSAATFLYHQLPNSTDLTAAMATGLPALNFAFLGGEFDYHTPRDRLASLDPRTLQSLGDQVLPVIRAVADVHMLPPRGDNGVFGDSALFAIRYPLWGGWVLLALIGVLGGWAGRGARLLPMARAAAGIVAIGTGAMLAARLGYGLTGVSEDWAEHHRIMAAFGRYEAALGLASLACVLGGLGAMRQGIRGWIAVVMIVGAGIVAALLGRPLLPTAALALVAAGLAAMAVGGPIPTRELRLGALVTGAILSLVLQLIAPPLTPLLWWPTLLSAAAAAATRRWPGSEWQETVLPLVPLAYVLMFAHAVLLALGVPTPEAVGVFALVVAIVIAPFATGAMLRLAMVLGSIAMLMLGAFRWQAASERYPALSQLWGVIEPDGRSWRVSALERPDKWTRAALGFDGGSVERAAIPLLGGDQVWRAGAQIGTLPAPIIVAVRDAGYVRLTVTPASGGREIRMLLDVDRPLGDATIDDVPIGRFAVARGRWRLRWRSAGQPVKMRFRAARGTMLSVVAGEMTERRLVLPRRPATVARWLGSDRIIVEAAARVRL